MKRIIFLVIIILISFLFIACPPKPYTLTISVTPTSAGTVTLEPSGGEYIEGEIITLTATAYGNYHFVEWFNGTTQLSTSTEYDFTMPAENTTIIARFEENPKFNLTVNIVDNTGTIHSEWGHCSLNPLGGQYYAGQQVVLTTTANYGYRFVKYADNSGVEISTNNPYTYTMPSADTTLRAVLEITPRFNIAINTYDASNNPISFGIINTNLPESETINNIPEGFNLQLKMIADVDIPNLKHYRPLKWTNADGSQDLSTNATYTFTVSTNITLRAVFTETNLSYAEDFETASGSIKNPEYWSDIYRNGQYPSLFSAIEDNYAVDNIGCNGSSHSVKLDASTLSSFQRIMMTIDLEVPSGQTSYIGFWYKVESNPTDIFGAKSKLAFSDGGYVDPSYEHISVSGSVNWTYYEYQLSEGIHEPMWKFLMVVPNSTGDNAAWLDNIIFGENINIKPKSKEPLVTRPDTVNTTIHTVNDDGTDDIGKVRTGGQDILYTLINDGKLDLIISSITTNNADGYYSITSIKDELNQPVTLPKTLTPFKTLIITLNINIPTVSTDVSGSVTITSDAITPLDDYTYTVLTDVVTPPSMPTGLIATNGTENTINLSWNNNAGTAAYFEIWKSASSGGTYRKVGKTTNATTLIYKENYSFPNTHYWFKVRVIDVDGVPSDFSNEDEGWNNATATTLSLDTWTNGVVSGFPYGNPVSFQWWHITGLTAGNNYYLYWKDAYDGGNSTTDGDIEVYVYKTDGSEYTLIDNDFGYPNGPITEEGNGEIITLSETEIWIRCEPLWDSSIWTGPYQIYFGVNAIIPTKDNLNHNTANRNR